MQEDLRHRANLPRGNALTHDIEWAYKRTTRWIAWASCSANSRCREIPLSIVAASALVLATRAARLALRSALATSSVARKASAVSGTGGAHDEKRKAPPSPRVIVASVHPLTLSQGVSRVSSPTAGPARLRDHDMDGTVLRLRDVISGSHVGLTLACPAHQDLTRRHARGNEVIPDCVNSPLR